MIQHTHVHKGLGGFVYRDDGISGRLQIDGFMFTHAHETSVSMLNCVFIKQDSISTILKHPSCIRLKSLESLDRIAFHDHFI